MEFIYSLNKRFEIFIIWCNAEVTLEVIGKKYLSVLKQESEEKRFKRIPCEDTEKHCDEETGVCIRR